VIISFSGVEMRSTDERRRHSRYSYFGNTEYILDPSTTDEICKCEVVNVSNRGMSLFSINPLDIGQKITIKSDVPAVGKEAVVRWIKKIEGFYRVGVEYIKVSGG
jgi:hypothetical protein